MSFARTSSDTGTAHPVDPIDGCDPAAGLELASCSLGQLEQVAALQTRRDRKYVIDGDLLAALLEWQQEHSLILTIDRRRAFDYSSVYFDTPDLGLFRAAAHGRRQRYKVRSRLYENAGSCVLEVKRKGFRGRTEKSRIEYRPADRAELTADGRNFIDRTVNRAGSGQRLGPVLTTAYRRSTLVDPKSGTRLTIDADLRCVDNRGATAALDGIVVETKSVGPPTPSDRWLWANGARPMKISKFCTGLAALHHELPSNRWHRAMAHWNQKESKR